jgi:deoxyribodipyrimidine photo-lyase
MIESLHDLRHSLRKRGSDLWIREGPTIDILVQLIDEIQPTEVCWMEEPGVYERRRSQRVYKVLSERYPTLKIYTDIQYTLYHPDDLPKGYDEWNKLAKPNQARKMKQQKHEGHRGKQKATKQAASEHKCDGSNHHHPQLHSLVDISHDRLAGMPRIMGEWRKAARATKSQSLSPRRSLPTPDRIFGYNRSTQDDEPIDPGRIPTLEEILKPLTQLGSSKSTASVRYNDRLILGIPWESIHKICSHAISVSEDDSRPLYVRGGEESGLIHLKEFVSQYAATARRNLACVDDHDSSRLSHFLAWGCLSPRIVIEEAERAMDEKKKLDDCSWLISHMTMRDFFLYLCLSTGSDFYQLDGIPVNVKAAEAIKWNSLDEPNVESYWIRWSSGDTGLPLVDAGMKELAMTGYLSNRVRQNTVSVLTKDLALDWRAGAEFFQFLLADFCVGSNYGNWLYFSGVGPDPKRRYFRTASQAVKYDRDGKYVRKWLTNLKGMSLPLSDGDESYLRPWDFDEEWRTNLIVPPESQYTWQDLQTLEDYGRLLGKDIDQYYAP